MSWYGTNLNRLQNKYISMKNDLKEAVKILIAPEKYKEMLSASVVTSMSLQQRKEKTLVFLSTTTRTN